MTDSEWKYFKDFCNRFKNQIEEWNKKAFNLLSVQQKAMEFFNNAKYDLETPIVYNTALDEIKPEDDIKLIVIGDNPGKDEQLAKNQKYLVGQAGKLGNNFFKNHEELEIDFRKNVIILNKTPIHSAKTNQLKKFGSFGGPEIDNLIEETQIWMAKETAKLHQKLFEENKTKEYPQLWLVGYSELKNKGIFTKYKEELKNQYSGAEKLNDAWKNVFVFQHFSMNRFTIDLGEFSKKNGKNLPDNLKKQLNLLGTLHKEEIF